MRQNLQDHAITADIRLRLYLDALDQPVAGLGDDARADWRGEAECHLRHLIAAHEELGSTHEELGSTHEELGSTHEELGSTHEEAVVAALAQFSRTPARTGTQVRRASAWVMLTPMQTFARAACECLIVRALGFAGLLVAAMAYWQLHGFGGSPVLMTVMDAGFRIVPVLGAARAWQVIANARGGRRPRTALS